MPDYIEIRVLSIPSECKWVPFMVRSKLQRPFDWRRARAASDASNLLGCIRIQPMPVPAQSVSKKQGRVELHHTRQGEEVTPSFYLSQR